MLLLNLSISTTMLAIVMSASVVPDASVKEWRVYNGDAGGTRYSSQSLINAANVAALKVAWSYHTGDKHEDPKSTIECNPIVVNGVMYVTSPQLKAIALNAATGQHLWTYDPYPKRASHTAYWVLGGVLSALLLILITSRRRSRRPLKVQYQTTALLIAFSLAIPVSLSQFWGKLLFGISPALVTEEEFDPWRVNRGVTYWEEGADQRILFVAGNRLIALNAQTGQPISAFGESGVVDLRKNLDRDIERAGFMVTSPGAIYQDLIILGLKTGEGPRPEAPGHIRAYDVRTGKRRWIFHTIPHPGEYGYETWSRDSWLKSAGANPWSGMTVDRRRGLVFASTGSPTFDFYGGDRPGANLFGDSVIALDAATGRRVWHFQAVHHNLWDYDLPCPPTLVTIERDGRKIDAVAQLTKMGFVFVLDRDTGKPLFPVEERPVPASDVPGEHTSSTQPFPMKPPALSQQIVTEQDLTERTPEAHAFALQWFRTLRTSGLFTPPSFQGTLETPGLHGGANWSGGSFDPATSTLYVNTNDVPYVVKLKRSHLWQNFPYDQTGYHKFLDPQGYPAIKPPWGRLSAIDLNRGEIRWQVPLGEYPELAARGVPTTGTENFGGSLVTAGGLVFIAATLDEKLRAFDKSTGRVLWEAKLEAGGYATPATYEANGKQFVVIAAGGGGQLATKAGDAFIAFALPD